MQICCIFIACGIVWRLDYTEKVSTWGLNLYLLLSSATDLASKIVSSPEPSFSVIYKKTIVRDVKLENSYSLITDAEKTVFGMCRNDYGQLGSILFERPVLIVFDIPKLNTLVTGQEFIGYLVNKVFFYLKEERDSIPI